MQRKYLLVIALWAITFSCFGQRWSVAKTKAWYDKQPWLVGANFIPSTAINQLEMWQAATFDTATIAQELGLAQGIGMNCMRVYLHHLAWKSDSTGFKRRVDAYLSIATRHQIKTIFVFLDDCWNDTANVGRQPIPKPGIHNSGWLKDPGNRWQKDKVLVGTLERYVKSVLRQFKNDPRILLWDLYNEPGMSDQHAKSLPLLKQVFIWARAINPSQPLTSGMFDDDERDLNRFQLSQSDVITYHCYEPMSFHQKRIDALRQVAAGRPLICTEYMARKRGSTFAAILPSLKEQKIGAINWGLVDGKTQTKYAWDEKQWGASEPALWFHDIFRKDGTPYDASETKLIRRLTTDSVTIFAVSDIEGEYDTFLALLRAGKVIDANGRWSFGKGQLVLTGDMNDRGDAVEEVWSLIRQLEKEAVAAGGAVHYVLGNHEIMNLAGDLRYVHKKYLESPGVLTASYASLLSASSENGQWLRGLPIMAEVGGHLFVHGGIAWDVVRSKGSVDALNRVAKLGYGVAKPDVSLVAAGDRDLFSLVYNTQVSPFWYRGYYFKAGEKGLVSGYVSGMESVVDGALKHFGVDKIITGHSVVGDTVNVHFGGKVINTDVRHGEGHSEGLLIEGGRYYRVNKEGERKRVL